MYMRELKVLCNIKCYDGIISYAIDLTKSDFRNHLPHLQSDYHVTKLFLGSIIKQAASVFSLHCKQILKFSNFSGRDGTNDLKIKYRNTANHQLTDNNLKSLTKLMKK